MKKRLSFFLFKTYFHNNSDQQRRQRDRDSWSLLPKIYHYNLKINILMTKIFHRNK